MKNVVVIGGGSGLSVMLRGLKNIQSTYLSAIVTVADDGGSTGRLRERFHIPAMGDIRNVMCALAEEETLFTQLMNFRFSGEDDIGGHNLGNLLLTALTETTGNFLESIQTFSKVLKVKGEIIPSTLQTVTLCAEMADGTVVNGQSNIPKVNNQIKQVFYSDSVHATEQAVNAIKKADLIVYGIGSLYTSIIPNIIISEIQVALKSNPCPKIYFCNAMTQPGETTGYSLEDHVNAITSHSFQQAIDTVVTYSNLIPADILQRYKDTESKPVTPTEKDHPYQILRRDLLWDENTYVRHDSEKIRAVVEELLLTL